MANIPKKIQEAGMILGGLGVIGFIGIIWMMIYGNLSGNTGFTVGSQNYNNTQNVILNQTSGFNTFFSFSGTFFTVAAIVLLIFMFIGLLAIVISITRAYGGGSRSGFT